MKMIKAIIPVKEEEIEVLDQIVPAENLESELKDAATSIIMTCKAKLRLYGEDINLTELQAITKIVKDMQTSFVDPKATVQANTQINISGSQIAFFQGLLK